MIVLHNIVITLDKAELVQTQKLNKIDDDIISSLLDETSKLIKPKAVYTTVKVLNVNGNDVALEGDFTFKSVMLASKLRRDQLVAPYVITIGRELEKLASERAKKSLIESFVCERIADLALSKTRQYLKSLVEEELGGKVSSLGPGTGTGELFSLDQQKVLFQILDPHKNIGVVLSPSYLMIPRKSVSGVFFALDQEYVVCQNCPRKCESRKKAYSGVYKPVECGYDHPMM
ncbi:MAG: vitamin B12 dependent-methionine synthase activation domain-containing protein [Nitrososphaeria archaeon]